MGPAFNIKAEKLLKIAKNDRAAQNLDPLETLRGVDLLDTPLLENIPTPSTETIKSGSGHPFMLPLECVEMSRSARCNLSPWLVRDGTKRGCSDNRDAPVVVLWYGYVETSMRSFSSDSHAFVQRIVPGPLVRFDRRL